MAFGDLIGTIGGVTTSVTNPFNATGSVTAALGNLIVVLAAERVDLTTTGITDNLGNTYTAQNAGTDAGNATGRLFWTIVTNSGTLTTVTAATTGGNDDYTLSAAVFAGPFVTRTLVVDATPANVSNDTTTPYTCPSTGTLAQSAELVIAWIAMGLARTMTASSPNLLAISSISAADGTANSCGGAIGYQVTAATTAVAPEFTAAGGSIAVDVLGTISFKQDTATQAPFGPKAIWPLPQIPVQPVLPQAQRSQALTATGTPFAQVDWPRPLIAAHPLSARTWLKSPPVPLLIDTVNMPCRATEWAAPIGPLYSVDLRGFIGPKVKQEFDTANMPCVATDWAAPIGPLYSVDLRTWIWPKTTFVQSPLNNYNWPNPITATTPRYDALGSSSLLTEFNVKPFLQTDWPPPKTAEYPNSLRTWTQQGVRDGLPIRQQEWPNPKTPEQPTLSRTWLWDGLRTGFPIRQQEWPLPSQVVYSVAPFIAPNTLLTTLAPSGPQPKPFANYDWRLSASSPFPASFVMQDLLRTTLAVPPDTTNMPCMGGADGLFAAARQLQTEASQGSPLSLLTAAKPFAQQDWPKPVLSASPPYFVVQDILLTTLAVPPDTTNLPCVAGTDCSFASVRQPQAEVSQGSLLLLLTAAPAEKPFLQQDWPKPILSAAPPYFVTQDQLLTTLAIPPDTTNLPCVAVDWLPVTAQQLQVQTSQGSLLSLLTAAKPFVQQDWPKPLGSAASASFVTQDLLLATLAIPPDTANMPCVATDWLPTVTRQVQRQTVQGSRFELLQAGPPPERPFSQQHWPVPRAPLYPVTLRTFIADATELLNHFEYVFRGAIFTRIPTAHRVQPFVAPNTLLTTLTATPPDTTHMPCVAVDWLPATIRQLRFQTVQGSRFELLLTSAAAGTPFAQTSWPNPITARPMLGADIQGSPRQLTEFNFRPFAQTEWPGPVGAQLTRSDLLLLGSSRLLTEFNTKPFLQPDWPVPQVAGGRSAEVRSSYLPLLQSVAEPKPFFQADWPGPIGARLTQSDLLLLGSSKLLTEFNVQPFSQKNWLQPIAAPFTRSDVLGSPRLLTEFNIKPFAQSQWDIPKLAVGNLAEVRSSYLPLLQSVEQPKPFAQTEWPNPIVVRTSRTDVLGSPLELTLYNVKPFLQSSWPLPQVAVGLPAEVRSAYLALLQSVTQPSPFSQLDWPKPVIVRTSRTDDLGSSRLLTEFNVKPFAQGDWPLPRLAFGVPAEVRCSYQPLLASDVALKPFAQLDWPNPVFVRVLRTDVLGSPTELTLNNAKPFVQSNWPIPQTPEHPVTARSWTVDGIRTGLPVRQQEWPLPKTAEYPVSARTWLQQGVTTGLPVRQQNWPLPIPSQFTRSDLLGSSRLLTEFNVQPFAQYLWPLPLVAEHPVSDRTWSIDWMPRNVPPEGSLLCAAISITPVVSGSVSVFPVVTGAPSMEDCG